MNTPLSPTQHTMRVRERERDIDPGRDRDRENNTEKSYKLTGGDREGHLHIQKKI